MADTGRGGPHCVVEIIGVAGSGKSTVFAELEARGESIAGRPHLSAIASLPRIGAALAGALTTLLLRRALAPGVAVEQMRMMAHLRLLPRFFRSPRAPGGMHVLDQGPIFYLTRDMLMHPRLGTWRSRALAEIGSAVDVVVWLDAPDTVLADRINVRPTEHRLKGTEQNAAVEQLTGARTVIRELVEELEAMPDGPDVLRFDTTTNASADVVGAVLEACSALRGS